MPFPPPRVRRSRDIHCTPWMSVREDLLAYPGGHEATFTVITKPAFAAVVPFDDGRFWLVSQYRHALRRTSVEFPQGGQRTDRPALTPAQLAERELAEECRLTARRLQPLGVVHEATGTTGQAAHVFLATSLAAHPGPPARDRTEHDLELVRLTPAELRAHITDGTITDATTLACLTLFTLHAAR